MKFSQIANQNNKPVSENTGATDYNPTSQGGSRKELVAKYHKTQHPRDAEAARRAGATQKELQGVAEGSKEKDPIWNKGTPMPKDYTCPCGIHVHPSVKKPSAVHDKDCPYAKKQGVAEGRLAETRDQLWTWIQSKFPSPQWPEYVQRDFLYAGAKGIRSQKDLVEWLESIQNDFGQVRWRLEKLPITLNIFTPKTQKQIMSREGGSKNPYQVPKDAERHALQQQMIQQKGVSPEPIIVAKLSNGYDLIEGWHRTIQHLKAYPNGYTGPAWVGYGATYSNESKQGVAEGRFDEPLTGWHIVSKAHDQVVRGTPSFETREQAQKYLMTKMFANHQDFKVVHTAHVAEGDDKYQDQMDRFLAGGGKIQQIPMKPPRKSERLGGSRHIGGAGDRPKSRIRGISANTQGTKVIGLPEQGVAESLQGYTYSPEVEREDDVKKIWHYIRTPSGKEITADFDPYKYMTKQDLELYISLGMPSRSGIGPLNSEQLRSMAKLKESVESFIITARTAEGDTKKYRVRADSEAAAQERFSQHHSQAQILSVKQEK